ncbi:uncharacterized protein G2W53_015484 [Senna tora]|uniref:Uncharacterized protein n=1 Tax=Senna tora TaxID=362788 RepID=A0A834WVB1_9FABA|nr:uncharacterized protein G2W53_015484 [Senna tora]
MTKNKADKSKRCLQLARQGKNPKTPKAPNKAIGVGKSLFQIVNTTKPKRGVLQLQLPSNIVKRELGQCKGTVDRKIPPTDNLELPHLGFQLGAHFAWDSLSSFRLKVSCKNLDELCTSLLRVNLEPHFVHRANPPHQPRDSMPDAKSRPYKPPQPRALDVQQQENKDQI